MSSIDFWRNEWDNVTSISSDNENLDYTDGNYNSIFFTVYNKSKKSIWCKNEDISEVFEV